MGFCYLNGAIVDQAKALIPIHDLGLTRGYGIFDFFRTYNGKPFLIEEHLKRFRDSASRLRITLKESDAEIKAVIEELITRNNLVDAGIRLVITGGKSSDGFSPGEPNFFITAAQLPDYPESCWSEGVEIMTHEFLRVFPDIKSNNYLAAIEMQEERADRGAFDILYKYQGKILEMTRGNFFIFKGNTLITAGHDILKGRTRNFIIELAKESGFEVQERDLFYDELEDADEAFLTGTTKKLMPVVLIDGQKVGSGLVGENTNVLLAKFNAFVKAF